MIFEKIKELENQIRYLSKEDKTIISKAINFSKDAHINQIRQSGDPFVTHPIEVAKILKSINLDASAIAAGSIFVYHGPHNAVLINYPSFEKKNILLSL